MLFSAKYVNTRFRFIILPFILKEQLFVRKHKMRGALKISGVRVQSLQFIENMRFQNEPYGRYKYAPCQKEPVLYASVYALLTRHLYNDLSNLTKKQREEWTEYIKSF